MSLPYTDTIADIEKAVTQTLIYSDFFNFPLSKNELWKYLKSDKYIKKKDFEIFLYHLPSYISYNHSFYFLQGRENLIRLRLQKEVYSKMKKRKLQKITPIFSLLPTILFVGISGSLALNNAHEDDDIDLFIITRPNTLWQSRLYISVALRLLGVIRYFNKKQTKDTLCINLWMDGAQLSLPKSRNDVFTAHEIAQLEPVVNKANTYEQFLQHNKWVKQCMPNAFHFVKPRIWKFNSYSQKAGIMEKIAKFLQIRYMERKRTNEIVQDTFLAFHPRDIRKNILVKLKKTMHKYSKKNV